MMRPSVTIFFAFAFLNLECNATSSAFNKFQAADEGVMNKFVHMKETSGIAIDDIYNSQYQATEGSIHCWVCVSYTGGTVTVYPFEEKRQCDSSCDPSHRKGSVGNTCYALGSAHPRCLQDLQKTEKYTDEDLKVEGGDIIENNVEQIKALKKFYKKALKVVTPEVITHKVETNEIPKKPEMPSREPPTIPIVTGKSPESDPQQLQKGKVFEDPQTIQNVDPITPIVHQAPIQIDEGFIKLKEENLRIIDSAREEEAELTALSAEYVKLCTNPNINSLSCPNQAISDHIFSGHEVIMNIHKLGKSAKCVWKNPSMADVQKGAEGKCTWMKASRVAKIIKRLHTKVGKAKDWLQENNVDVSHLDFRTGSDVVVNSALPGGYGKKKYVEWYIFVSSLFFLSGVTLYYCGKQPGDSLAYEILADEDMNA